MRIPAADRAVVSREKVVAYLLNVDHPDGAGKARWLALAGFDASRPEELEQALKECVLSDQARLGRPSLFGTKYEMTHALRGPIGSVTVTSIWMVRIGESFPRLVTLIPERQS